MAADYLLKADAASKLTLADGTGFLILASSTPVGGAPFIAPKLFPLLGMGT